MTTRYLDLTDDTSLARVAADLDAAYMADMRARLGRGPTETIDSVVDSRTGAILRPANRVITTRLVAPLTVAGTAGGVIAVDDLVRSYSGKRAPSGRTIDLSAEKDAAQVRAALRVLLP